MAGPLGISRYGGHTRVVPLALGARYRVEPLSPAKLTHRDRSCVLLALFDRNRHPTDPPPEGIVDPGYDAALIRFADTGALGRLDPNDLVAAE